MFKITGYMLRDAIKQAEFRVETTLAQFNDSLFTFPEEKKPSPEESALEYEKAQMALVHLRTAQARYNLAIQLAGFELSLAEGIKKLTALCAVDKIWRGTTHQNAYRSMVRNTEQVVATMTVTAEMKGAKVKAYAKQIGKLRQAIAVANAQEFEAPAGLDASLFE